MAAHSSAATITTIKRARYAYVRNGHGQAAARAGIGSAGTNAAAGLVASHRIQATSRRSHDPTWTTAGRKATPTENGEPTTKSAAVRNSAGTRGPRLSWSAAAGIRTT